MKRYFFEPYDGGPTEAIDGEYVLFEDAQAAQEALRTSYVTLECQYARLMDQYMEIKGQMARLQQRPIERPLCQFGGSYGWCELEPGHDGPHKITRAGVLEAKGDTP